MWYKYTSNTYGKDKGKGKVVPVLNQTPRHEDVSGNGDIAPRPGHFTPHPVPTGSEAGWAPELDALTKCKLLSLRGRKWKPGRPSRSLVTILTELPRFQQEQFSYS
jgi:hypothetical protein